MSDLNKEDELNKHPNEKLRQSLVLWFFFVLSVINIFSFPFLVGKKESIEEKIFVATLFVLSAVFFGYLLLLFYGKVKPDKINALTNKINRFFAPYSKPTEAVFEFTMKLFAAGIGIALLGGILALLFGVLTSLSTTALLVIIILILIFKNK